MENEDSLNNQINLIQKNLPINSNNNNHNNILTYSDIFDSRDDFYIFFGNQNSKKIIITRQSLYKISTMIDINPEEYISYSNYQEKDKLFNINLFKKEDKNFKSDENNNNDNIEENNDNADNIINEDENIIDNEIDEGFKKVENLEDNLFDFQIYKQCFCFYLFIVFCAFWDLLFCLYIIIVTVYKSHFYTIYTLILFLLNLFTAIFGAIKCKNKNFSGYILKIVTFLLPIFVIIGTIIYYATDIKLGLYWVKIIVDILTLVISIILILFITGIIKAKIIRFYNNNNNNNEINQNLINNSNYKNISKEEKNFIIKF